MTPQFEADFRNRLMHSDTGTGSSPVQRLPKTKLLELDHYEVVLAVTEEDRVIGIVEVRVKKDFRSLQQKLSSTGYIDVEQHLR